VVGYKQRFKDATEKNKRELSLEHFTIEANKSATITNKWMPYLTASLVLVSVISLIRDEYRAKKQSLQEEQFQKQKATIDSFQRVLKNYQIILSLKNDSLKSSIRKSKIE
jgi:hypothetical protein